jgi:hypothetical protein
VSRAHRAEAGTAAVALTLFRHPLLDRAACGGRARTPGLGRQRMPIEAHDDTPVKIPMMV